MTIFVPPTGNQALDLVLEQLASNVGNVSATTANTVVYNSDGSIQAGGTIIGYRDRYIYVIYTDDPYGSGQSSLPTGKLFWGRVNTNQLTYPTNPLSYSYSQVSGGFGTTKNLYYKTTGGRNIQWQVSTTSPGSEWLPVPNTAGTYVAIDLDLITVASANGFSAFSASVFQSNTGVPATPSGGTYTFSTGTLVPPTGWFSNVPVATDNVYVASYLFTSNTQDTVTAGSWSSPSAVYRLGINGNTTVVGVVYQANSLTPPAINTDGYYDFGNNILTAPSGWSNVIPSNPSNTTVWSSQASFVTGNSQANISNTTSWSSPAITFQSGGAGPPGTRGFIPLAYVITPGDPRAYTDQDYTNVFSASRSSPFPPIGTGYAPIAGDTAQFSGGGYSVVKSFNGVNWVTSQAQVIDGSVIVTGTLTAAQMNTNSIYALTMRGGTVANITDYSNVGYFIEAGSGDALFTGNVRIGNRLTIGNLVTSAGGQPRLAANTVDANSITPGSIVASLIAANTIVANNIASGTITADKLAANVLNVGNIVSFNANIGNISSNGYWLRYDTGDVRFGGNVSIGANLNVQGLINGGVLAANTVGRTNLVPGTIPSDAGISFVPTTVVAGPGKTTPGEWDGLSSFTSGGTAYQILYKYLGYYQYKFPQNITTSLTFRFNLQCNLLASTWAPTGGSFPTILVYLNGVNNPTLTFDPNNSFNLGNARPTSGWTGTYNGLVSWSATFQIQATSFNTAGNNYFVAYLLQSNLATTPGTWQFTNINFTATVL